MMKHRVLALVSLPCSVAFAGIIAAACVGDATTTGTDLDGGADATATGQSDGGGGASDGGSTTNDSGGSATCTPGCSTQTTLTACFTDGGSSTTNCAFDCTADGGAHCLALVASPPVLPADLALAGLSAVNITADGFLSTDTGTIDGVRGANPTPMTPDTQQGVRLHVHNGVGIYSMKTLTIAQGVTLKLRGTLPVALVADTIDVKGVIDLRGYDATGVLCIGNVAGPGGFIGGPGTTAGGGPGGGAASGNNNSGGGGANGADGGNGGAAMGQTNYALGGPSVPFQLPIVGGSGGGSCTGNQTKGGGGGGAVQLVGVTEVKIGNAGSTGGLNAGGCGGSSGAFGSAGGGGGSGGTILIECRRSRSTTRASSRRTAAAAAPATRPRKRPTVCSAISEPQVRRA